MKAAKADTAPCLVVTPGEPAGIGPDILLQWATAHVHDCGSRILVLADPDLLESRARQLGLSAVHHIVSGAGEAMAGRFNVLPVALRAAAHAGRLDTRNARYVLETLERAARLCLEGRADAIVTGPVQKSVINDAGIAFSGHTEFFADVCSRAGGSNERCEPVMMLATPGLRVALVTTHLPLREVAAQVTADRLRHCLHVLHGALRRDFAVEQPHILVAGLNPHAGENGHLGSEERDVIEPVLAECREQGMAITGPLPADTLFTPSHLQQADAVLAMYHDQGLPVLKHVGFGHATNITLGLPIIRTSVDHGTALDLAGSGQADSGSFAYALEVAGRLATSRRQTGQGTPA